MSRLATASLAPWFSWLLCALCTHSSAPPWRCCVSTAGCGSGPAPCAHPALPRRPAHPAAVEWLQQRSRRGGSGGGLAGRMSGRAVPR